MPCKICPLVSAIRTDTQKKVPVTYTSFSPSQATGVGRPTSEASRQTMRVLVNDDTGLKVSITVRLLAGPRVHAHAGTRAVGRGSKVGVIGTRAVLSVGLNGVAAEPATSKVVLLEVAGFFVESVPVVQIVNLVVGVEQLRNRSVDVRRRLEGNASLGPVQRELEIELLAARGTVAVHTASSVRVVLSNDIVATCVLVRGSLATLDRGGHSMPSSRRGYPSSTASVIEITQLSMRALTFVIQLDGLAGESFTFGHVRSVSEIACQLSMESTKATTRHSHSPREYLVSWLNGLDGFEINLDAVIDVGGPETTHRSPGTTANSLGVAERRESGGH